MNFNFNERHLKSWPALAVICKTQPVTLCTANSDPNCTKKIISMSVNIAKYIAANMPVLKNVSELWVR